MSALLSWLGYAHAPQWYTAVLLGLFVFNGIIFLTIQYMQATRAEPKRVTPLYRLLIGMTLISVLFSYVPGMRT